MSDIADIEVDVDAHLWIYVWAALLLNGLQELFSSFPAIL
jgi:hypothetical protein